MRGARGVTRGDERRGLRASLAPRASAHPAVGRAMDERDAPPRLWPPRRRDRSSATPTPRRDDRPGRLRRRGASRRADDARGPPPDPALGDASAPARPPVETCQHVHLGSASSVAEALRASARASGVSRRMRRATTASGGGSCRRSPAASSASLSPCRARGCLSGSDPYPTTTILTTTAKEATTPAKIAAQVPPALGRRPGDPIGEGDDGGDETATGRASTTGAWVRVR